MNQKICFITNIGTHYRFPIYNEISINFDCDFYIGDRIYTPINKFKYETLRGYKKTLNNVFFKYFYWQKGCIKLIFKPYQYYVFDGEPYNISSWVVLILLFFTRKNTIAWTHGWYGRENIVKRIIKRIYFSLYSKLLVYSNYAINLMEKEGINKDKMYCIANSLDSDHDKKIRSCLKATDVYKAHFRNGNPTIIYCGRIQKIKKLDLLVDAICTLNKEGIKINIVLVGKDVDNINLDKYAELKGVSDKLWFYGPCYDSQILGELFYNASVCVSPGNVGLTAIHSLTFGCPVITHGNFPYQMPEFESIVPNVTGSFFEQDNAKDLAEKIKKWVTIDDTEREKVRQAAFAEIDRKWNIHYQIDILKQVFND
ncbi:MAG: glycosyltransferase [Prevotella sp.]